MAEPIFTRTGTTPLYWSDPVTAFLATDPDALGASVTLTRTWSDTGGCYLFLGMPATDPAAFLTALSTWLYTYAPLGAPRFLWIADPAAPPTGWLTTQLTVRPGPGGTWRSNAATFQLADHRLRVTGGGAITPADTPAGWGFTVADVGGWSAVALFSPTDLFPAQPGTTVLAMEPDRAGAWRFRLDGPAGGDLFTRLGAGMRFFTPGADGFVDSVNFAVVHQPVDTALEFHAQVDPLRPLDPDGTWLSFFPWTPQGTAAALPSGYVTVLGREVALRPLATGAGAPARLVFCVAPYLTGAAGNAGHHLCPAGPFAVTAGPDARVVCGISGLEYLRVPDEGATLVFVPGQPAYAQLATDVSHAGALTSLGTTSWVSVEPPTAGSIGYHSQPEDAPVFGSEPATPVPPTDAIVLLGFRELPAAVASQAAYPMAPFRGLVAGTVAEAVAIEQLALAPTRRAVLLPPDPGEAAVSAEPGVVVTPQGLAVGLAADGTWDWLGIGHDGDPAPKPDLRFTTVEGSFRQAMQTNNLFLVLGDPDEFQRFGSVGYRLSTIALDVIATIPETPGGVRPAVLTAVRAAMADRDYDTRIAFVEALHDALVPVGLTLTDAERDLFLRYAGQLTPIVGGWSFRLAPDAWRPSTYLIMKFALGRTIREFVANVSTWAWPKAASRTGDPADAQAAIQAVLDAVDDAPDDFPYAMFRQVIDDPNWTGTLALGAEVPLDVLPAELQALAAGIDPGRFTAHHLGISVTPYRTVDGGLVFDRSTTFGLIDYENVEDQYFTENIAYAFRVLRLTVGVRNTVTTSFGSRVELLVNRLFGAPARLLPTTRGNNIVLDGALQRQLLPDGTSHDTYVFSMSGENTFLLDGPVLCAVELLSTQLVMTRAATGDAPVEAVFQLAGNLHFHEPDRFDPFCWGSEDGASRLRFGGLAIVMSFRLGDPAGSTEFALRTGGLSFDLAHSPARPDALISRFPLRLAGLIGTADPALVQGDPPPPQTPADLGYVSVTAPIDQSPLNQPWYGLDYVVDLGTLGALAGSAAVTLRVLVAWSAGTTDADPGLYLGVKLPGADGLVGVNLPLQGFVTMGFKSVEFIVNDGPPRTYTLRLRDFALRVLGLAFPPGHNDVILFGNPDQSGESKLGWYLAYASDADPKRPAPAPTRATLPQLSQGTA